MSEKTWKVCQRRIARMWGSEATWRGEHGSDARNCVVSLEVKRSGSSTGGIQGAWIRQARTQGKAEGKPFVLVVAGHNDRAPVAVVDHAFLVELARKAGLITEAP